MPVPRSKKTVLFVEDESELLTTIGGVLRDQGYDVVGCESAESALALMERKLPDLLLIDIKLPGIDGFDFLETVRSNSRWRETPVVFLTAFNDMKAKLYARTQGAADYITKPFEFDYLVARIREILPP